jgi:hypothetical protein
MAQYIFTLSKPANAGDSHLLFDLVQNDKITDTSYDIVNVVFVNYHVSTFNSIQAIPDFTTIVSVCVQKGIFVVELSGPILTGISVEEDIIFYDHINKTNMLRIGADKTSVPKIKQNQQLIDIVTGDTMIDEYGNPLVTEAIVNVKEFASSARSTSLVLNTETPIIVQDIFPETSEVSRSLLGISKTETQLGLFSDVSILGIDDETWETKSTGRRVGEYDPWGLRRSQFYGKHYYASLVEVPEEQALELTIFPTPYTYPWPQGDIRHRPQEFERFKIFVDLGNKLYTYFKDNAHIYGDSFFNNFLDGDIVKIGSISALDVSGNVKDTIPNQLRFIGISEEMGMLLIDIWTNTFIDINEGRFFNPVTKLPFTRQFLTDLINNNDDPFNNGLPGYTVIPQEEVVLESKRTFRYQPGRISGFTFGVRCAPDSGSENNIMEWGTYNPTDQYLFQVRGSNINIVRRSTIPLPEEVLRDYNLEQTTTKFIDPVTKIERDLYELLIPRSSWNIDSLDGNGPSRYLLDTTQVTMYKIEFSWYGAIGVNFYAYIPVANNEARWVRLNRIVIENKMNNVCLEDPFFKFRYLLNIEDPSKVRRPQYVYKYGASYYIDGADEGSQTFNTVTSTIKSTSSETSNIILGVYPRPTIQSSTGTSKKNKKLILLKNADATSTTQLGKLDIVHCKACPGFGYTHDIGLTAKDTLSKSVQFYFDDFSNANGDIKFKTRYKYAFDGISVTSEIISITAAELPDRVKEGSRFKFDNDDTNIYAVTDITVNPNNTITFNVSSPVEDLPIGMSNYSGDLIFLDSLLTIKDHNSKIIVEGLYGFYIDMESIIENTSISDILLDGDTRYYDTAYMLKIINPRNKSRPTSLKDKSTSCYDWTIIESQNQNISGGLSQIQNGVRTVKLIDLSYFTLQDDSTIRYYPKPAILSDLKICTAASDFPIESPQAVIQFLNPKKRYNSRHVCDFLIGVTSRKPVYEGGELKFDYDGVPSDLEESDLLYIEHISNRVEVDSTFDRSEIIDSKRERFDIDRVIKPVPSKDDAGGVCSKIIVEIPETLDITDCTILSGITIKDLYSDVSLDNIIDNRGYLITQDSRFDVSDITLTGGEIGIDGVSSGISFSGELSSFEVTTTNELGFVETDTYYYVETTASTERTTIFTVSLTYVELRYPTGDGELSYESKRKIFNFNPFPLYLVVRMTDRAKINSLNIKQVYTNSQQTIAPNWLHTDGVVLDTVKGKAVPGSLPENFTSKHNLDATSFDVSSDRFLRDEIQQVKASFYIGADSESKTTKIDLNSIYGYDKSIITQDLFGVDAVFLTSRNIGDNNELNSAQITLNVSEQ